MFLGKKIDIMQIGHSNKALRPFGSKRNEGVSMDKELEQNNENLTVLPPETALEDSLARKKKKKRMGPGHLQERNHFDAKDIILLVVMLIIIYGIMTWVDFFTQQRGESLKNNATQTESVSSGNTAE